MKHQLQMVSEVKMGRTYQCIHNITVQFNYIFEELIEKKQLEIRVQAHYGIEIQIFIL